MKTLKETIKEDWITLIIILGSYVIGWFSVLAYCTTKNICNQPIG